MGNEPKLDWQFWRAYDVLEIWEAVALSLGRDPATIKKGDAAKWGQKQIRLAGEEPSDDLVWRFNEDEQFDKRLSVFKSAAELSQSPLEILDGINRFFIKKDPSRWKVMAASAREFLVSRGFTIPKEWHTPTAARRWPWGDYETRLLGILDETARRFWVRYDPKESDTTPKQAVIAAWLKDEYPTISGKEIAAIDKILRAANIKKGPRT